MPVYLRPMAATAPDAILCGDPARALALAQELTVAPRMSNHHRGLWGYLGETPAGRPLTVQATGIGGPSAAAVLAELHELGVRRVVRVGTCRCLDPDPPLAALVAVAEIHGRDGASASLGRDGTPIRSSPELFGRLRAGTARSGDVLSIDLPAGLLADHTASSEWPAGPRLVDLQSATLAVLAAELGIEFAAGLLVSAGPGGRLEDDPLDAAALRLGRIAADALST